MKLIPIDLVYALNPNEDGSGYAMTNIGAIAINFVPRADLVAPVQKVALSTNIIQPQVLSTPEEVVPPSPNQVDIRYQTAPNIAAQGVQEFDNAFKFKAPVSQAEALRRMGIEEPKRKVHNVRESDSEPTSLKGSSPKKPRKSKKVAHIDDSAPTENDPTLPNPVSRSSRKVSGISAATQAEADAASISLFK